MAAGQSRGSVLPAPNFHAERSAIKLQKAMKGIGTDEKVVIEVLTTNSNSQRQEIRKKYKTLYGKDLAEDLKAELGGHFEELCSTLLMPHDEYLVECLRKAVKGPGTDEAGLIDILCLQKQNEVETLTNLYKEKFGADLENDLEEDTSGTFKNLIRSLLSGGREESPAESDEDSVNTDVQTLHNAANEGDSDTFVSILNTKSFDHLKQVFDVYPKVAEKDIEETISALLTGDSEKGYLCLVKIIKSEPDYFAERINSCINGMGTDDGTLIRIIVTHSETDLNDIKEKFRALYNKDLPEVVAGDTSGDYRKMLLKLLG